MMVVHDCKCVFRNKAGCSKYLSLVVKDQDGRFQAPIVSHPFSFPPRYTAILFSKWQANFYVPLHRILQNNYSAEHLKNTDIK